VEIAAQAEYPLYLKQVDELRKVLKKLVGWNNDNQKKAEEIAQKYKSEVEELLKERKTILETVTLSEKEKILNKALKIGAIGAGIGVGIAAGVKLWKAMKNKKRG